MKRNPEEIGAAFERYVGKRYEQLGWVVWYRGIERGKGDLGIDLVASKAERQVLIQCKCWTAMETVPHVEILHFAEACGRYIARRENPQIDAFPGILPLRSYGMAFLTTGLFSEPAKRAAQTAGVVLRERMPMPPIVLDGPCVEFATPRRIGPRPARLEIPEQTPFSASAAAGHG